MSRTQQKIEEQEKEKRKFEATTTKIRNLQNCDPDLN